MGNAARSESVLYAQAVYGAAGRYGVPATARNGSGLFPCTCHRDAGVRAAASGDAMPW